MILALETATNVCSVAFRDSDNNIFEKRFDKRGSHSEKLFLFIEELMNEHDFKIADLNAVLVSEGPGSYTGLRISASAVKGLLFQSGVALYGVNTLASFAIQAEEDNSPTTIHSIIDARRKHVYHQSFICDEGLAAKSGVEVIPIKKFEAVVKEGDVIIGTGLDRIEEGVKEKARIFGKESITAKSLIRLYQTKENDFMNETNPEEFEPKYYTSNQVNNSI